MDLLLLCLAFGPAPRNDGDLFGASIVHVGDQDGDGIGDFAVGAPLDGSVRVFSSNGDLVNTIRGSARGGSFGQRIAVVDDLDGDGRREVAIQGGDGRSTIMVVDPLTQSPRYVLAASADFEVGGPFACVGDTNDDRLADVGVLSTTGHEIALVVFSGSDGALLQSIRLHSGPLARGKDGVRGCVVRAGDRDGDGVEDVFVGLDGLSKPRVELVSIKTGTKLRELRPSWKYQNHYGSNVTVLGDLDADGAPDLALVEPNETADWPSNKTFGSVTVLSNELKVLYRIRDLARRRGVIRANGQAHLFGSTILPVDDLDGNGADDLAIVDPASGGGVSIHSGSDGSLIREWPDDLDHGIGFAHAAALIGDVDGDGHADLAVSRTSWYAPSVAGSVHVFSTGTGNELYELRIDGRVESSASAPK